MSQENPILEYASPPITAKVKFPTAVRVVVLLLIWPALVLPFVKCLSIYCQPMSPLEAMVVGFHMITPFFLGLYFLMGIPLVLCHLGMLISEKFVGAVSAIGYVVAFLATVPLVLFLLWIPINIATDQHVYMPFVIVAIVAFTVSASVIGLGSFALWFLGWRISDGTRVCTCLCIPYATVLLLCVVGFVDGSIGRYVGYWLSLPVVVGCLIEIATLTVMAFRQRA